MSVQRKGVCIILSRDEMEHPFFQKTKKQNILSVSLCLLHSLKVHSPRRTKFLDNFFLNKKEFGLQSAYEMK